MNHSHHDKAAHTSPTPPSRQLQRAIEATERLVRAVEAEFGLLDAAGIAERYGASAPDAEHHHREGALLAIRRSDACVFPGFQFQTDGTPRPVISALRALADTNQWSQSDLFLWLVSPTGYLDDARPVDLLMMGNKAADERLIATADMEMTLEW
jgi:hypothetical protein